MQYEKRKYIIVGIFIFFSLVLLGRLFVLQVQDPSYKDLANSNYIRKKTTYPARGLVYDRNGKLLVDNQPIYDLMVTPKDARQAIDTSKFCNLFNIDKATFVENFTKAARYSNYNPSVFLKQISPVVYAKAQEYLYLFPGFFTQVRTIRSYNTKSAPHVFGYLGEVSQAILDTSKYYGLGDFTGISGVEKGFEKNLRGTKGEKYVIVDAFNREQETYRDGAEDVPAEQGQNLQLTIDIDLQNYGEALMQNKIGSVIAIEPSSGEILSMISSPSYDPSLLTGRSRGMNMQMLNMDTLKRQLNRCITATYPPGSTLKPLVALIALQEGVIHANFYQKCGQYYPLGSGGVRCSHAHTSCGTTNCAIEQSCNPYFCEVFRRTIDNPKYENSEIALQKWIDYLREFDLGNRLDFGIPGMVKGTIPNVEYYNKLYNTDYWHWKSSTIISLSIGQGEFAITPMHLANSTSIIANRGVYYKPRIVKNIEAPEPKVSSIERRHFDTVAEGMERVMTRGTGRWSAVEGIDMCGKTGTAENPHGDDHSIFIAFAPKNNPQIAIGIIVENAGYGSTYAAPIASLMIEKYLNDTISKASKYREIKMFESNLINPNADKEETNN